MLPNPLKPEALELTPRLVRLLSNHDFFPVLEQETAALLKLSEFGCIPGQLWDELDLVMVLGGDGSMLTAARRVYPRQIPLLGINLGHLGFLTWVESNRLEAALQDLQCANFSLEDRTMLEARVSRNGEPLKQFVCLNDLVLAKGSFARIIQLETWIDESYFTTYPADGLIVATATGSTAYSLSAGGPILDPRMDAIVVTPICAHSLYARPVVLNHEARVKVVLNANHKEIVLTADGQEGVALQPGDEIIFTRASRVTRLLSLGERGPFEVLQSRLKEGRI